MGAIGARNPGNRPLNAICEMSIPYLSRAIYIRTTNFRKTFLSELKELLIQLCLPGRVMLRVIVQVDVPVPVVVLAGTFLIVGLHRADDGGHSIGFKPFGTPGGGDRGINY
jgi:hypothetical protein